MRRRDPLVVFWIAVLVAVVALGFAWSAWKVTSPLALIVAAPATLICAAAAVIAGRVLIAVTRAQRSARVRNE